MVVVEPTALVVLVVLVVIVVLVVTGGWPDDSWLSSAPPGELATGPELVHSADAGGVPAPPLLLFPPLVLSPGVLWLVVLSSLEPPPPPHPANAITRNKLT